MKLTTDNVRLVIEPEGKDSPVVNGIPQGWILVVNYGAVIEVWEAAGQIHSRVTSRRDLQKRQK